MSFNPYWLAVAVGFLLGVLVEHRWAIL